MQNLLRLWNDVRYVRDNSEWKLTRVYNSTEHCNPVAMLEYAHTKLSWLGIESVLLLVPNLYGFHRQCSVAVLPLTSKEVALPVVLSVMSEEIVQQHKGCYTACREYDSKLIGKNFAVINLYWSRGIQELISLLDFLEHVYTYLTIPRLLWEQELQACYQSWRESQDVWAITRALELCYLLGDMESVVEIERVFEGLKS